MNIYPPDEGPDPFVSDGTPSARVARAIFDRFTAGDSVVELARDYRESVDEVDRILRWAIARLRTRRSLLQEPRT